MTITATGGVASATVTSGAEVDLLSSGSGSDQGIAIPRAYSWTLTVQTDEEIVVRVYLGVGPNVGLAYVSGLTTTVTLSAQYLVIQQSEYPAGRIRVTAQATGTTASVNADFVAQSSTVN